MSRQITHDGTGALEVRFPYDRQLVDRIKTLPRRRWDATKRSWWIPETDVVLVVDLLNEHDFIVDEATRSMYGVMGGTATLNVAAPPRPSDAQPGLFDEAPAPAASACADLTVSALNQSVQAAIRSAFPAPVWLVGEIAGYDKSAHRKHVGFEMVERLADGSSASKVSAILFQSARQSIEGALHRAGDPFRLQDEITVRMRVRVELYEAWGQYRVVVEELDLNYTLGEAARRREEIIRRLTEAGLAEKNSALELPRLPLRVALITSLRSDAYNDVLRTFHESGFAFSVAAHGARVQGHSTEPSVLNALDWIRGRRDEFDVVLICRGGGSRTDLVWFDSEPLGRAVAGFPLPVVVGIGHEQDSSVLDAVARSCKTPTAAASLLVQRVRESLERVEEAGRAITGGALLRIRQERRDAAERGRRLALAARSLLRHESAALSHRRHRVVAGSRAVCAAARRQASVGLARLPRGAVLLIERQRGRVGSTVRSMIGAARADLRSESRRIGQLAPLFRPAARRLAGREGLALEGRERRLQLVHPRRVLERGYAILRLEDGPVVTDAGQAAPDSIVRAELRRGRLRLRSEGSEAEDEERKPT